MLQSLLRKYASPLSLLAVLMAAIAAPYLAPEDPDSLAFRFSSLSALLLFAAFVPVRSALCRHSLRALLYGCSFSFLFILCLGVGNELAFYDQLLPGTGSLLRRFAIPILATPLMGALVSYAFSFIPENRSKAASSVPYLFYFLLFSVCYGLVMLAFYPGVIAYDFEHEYAQYTTGVYNAAHPVFHTLFLGTIYQLGKLLLGSLTAGAAVYSTVQLLLLAAMYAYACVFVQRRINRPLVILALTACFALLPFHGILAISTAKDPLFTGLCVLLCLWLWEIAENPSAFLDSKFRIIRFGVCCLLMALLRHNGVFAYIPACLSVLLLCKGRRARAALICTASIACALLIPKGLETLMNAQKTPSSEMMSIPCQQLLRTAARADISEEEREDIGAWFSYAMHRYNPHCADAAKGGNFDFARYQENPDAFWSMYLHYAKAQPRVYIEAFLENCAGLWNPDDTSHAELCGEEYDLVYLLTGYYYEDGRFDLHPQSKLPKLRKLVYDYTHHAKHQNTLFLAPLFCPATYTFLLLLTTLLFFFRRERRLALCTLPLWGIFLSLLFSAGIFIRYAYPLMAGVPLLFALAFFREREA